MIRWSVSALFLVNGLMVGAWAPRIPALMERLGITEARAGLIVLGLGLGSLCLMPVFGAMVARAGSRRAVMLAAWLAAPSMIWISLAPDFWTVAATVALFGGLAGGMDVAMNANAVAVERARGRAIMSSCHGFWSLGAFVGAAAGGWLIQSFGELFHGLAVTAAFAGVLVWAGPRLLADGPRPGAPKVPLRLPRSPLPWLIGLMALAAMIPEGAILDWAAVYLQREMGASLALAGWGFAACAGTMAVMRFLGDGLRRRYGAVRTLRASTGVAMAGLALAGLAEGPGLAIAGFALAGIGIANMVPIAFSAAGNVPGLAAGVGLSVVTMMGYSGILLAPGSIGFLAEHVSLGSIYLGLAALLVLPLALSRLAATADFEPRG
ncbi:MFS transporter [Paracoccus aestuarii]|uniref:MFS transporter n=1 Tax=Paracoccus aestuarii TaxID=453842 RepID=A0A419A013_9RHOB|nr:MFS transporter [Paracoccus aestuarii]RJL06241.1 MFS transporter [Paracoccus aestuarii]WCR00282.1 MFS transporter [Paracoccus aestuarii]